MGRPGLTQARFDEVADQLLIAGERPTVERMRRSLGTGSSLTVQRLLDSWWKGLGERLTTNAVKLALPDAPESVAVLAAQFWEQALAAARLEAATALERERAALIRLQLEGEAEVAAAVERAQVAARQRTEALLAAEVLETRIEDRQRLIDQQMARIGDLVAAREALGSRVDALEAELSAVRTRLDRAQGDTAVARESSAQHIRAVEDRAHQEVDRARQDAAERTRQMQLLEKERQREARAAQEQMAALRKAVTTAQHAEAAERARRETLEEQLAQLRAELGENLSVAAKPKQPSRNARKTNKKPAATRKMRTRP